MSSLSKTISLVAAAAAVAGPTPVGAQAQAQAQRREVGLGSGNFLPHQSSDDRALRISDGDNDDANATAAAAVPEVASIVNGTSTGGPRSYMVALTWTSYGACLMLPILFIP